MDPPSCAQGRPMPAHRDGSADHLDIDQDARDNFQEWRCGTDPTNALSVLRLLRPEPFMGHVLVRWESVPGQVYYVERSTNLMAAPPFLLLATNLIGEAGTTLLVDPEVMGSQPCFYRIGVP